MKKFLVTLTAVSALSLPAVAAPPQVGYVGRAVSNVDSCPYILWRLAKHDDGKITGIVYYSDLSGASAANGTVVSGNFQIAVRPVLGNGPAGTIDGTRLPDGAMQARMTGSGCANASWAWKPVNLNIYGMGGG
jgi:hypothetical protein